MIIRDISIIYYRNRLGHANLYTWLSLYHQNSYRLEEIFIFIIFFHTLTIWWIGECPDDKKVVFICIHFWSEWLFFSCGVMHRWAYFARGIYLLTICGCVCVCILVCIVINTSIQVSNMTVASPLRQDLVMKFDVLLSSSAPHYWFMTVEKKMFFSGSTVVFHWLYLLKYTMCVPLWLHELYSSFPTTRRSQLECCWEQHVT